jgi:hypothetical protein
MQFALVEIGNILLQDYVNRIKQFLGLQMGLPLRRNRKIDFMMIIYILYYS